jgi:hypothetical protein
LVLKVLLLIVAALVVVESAGAAPLDLKVQTKLSTRENVHLSFKAAALPEGGYYYAVIVLKAPYKRHNAAHQPRCAVSSNMQRTDYGYPHDDVVLLALTPTTSRVDGWCAGGSYEGGIYAVPRQPPCESAYPCRPEYEEGPPNLFCPPGTPQPCLRSGVVAIQSWRWPDSLPAPLAKGTRVIDHFTIKFPKRS